VRPLDLIHPILGGTPTGARLKERLTKHIDKLDKAVGKVPDYGEIKPLDLIVITDGVPSAHTSPLQIFLSG